MTLDVRRGMVREVAFWAASDRRAPDAEADLGRVDSEDAANYLLDLARASDRDDVGEDALATLSVIDDVVVWPGLLELARDRRLTDDTREAAIFWLGQEAAEAATDGLSDLASDDGEDEDVREAAVFALSQQPREVGMPALMDLARSSTHADVRESALFWLAQSKDPAVLDFFEEILSGSGG